MTNLTPDAGDDPGSVPPGTPGTENLPTIQETAAVMEMLGDWCRATGARDLPASMMGDVLGDMAAAIQRVRAVMK